MRQLSNACTNWKGEEGEQRTYAGSEEQRAGNERGAREGVAGAAVRTEGWGEEEGGKGERENESEGNGVYEQGEEEGDDHAQAVA